METCLEELRYKEVISVTDGARYGYVGDLRFDSESGQIRALVVPGPGKYFFGLLGPRQIWEIPWGRIRCIGPDLILAEGTALSRPGREGRKRREKGAWGRNWPDREGEAKKEE